MSKLTCYQSRILGNHMTRYFPDFPLAELLKPIEGWKFCLVTLWRKGKPDECWRLLYRRSALGEQPEVGE
jgi:hypothetical protein